MFEPMWTGIMPLVNCPIPYRDYIKEDVDAIFAASQLNNQSINQSINQSLNRLIISFWLTQNYNKVIYITITDF